MEERGHTEGLEARKCGAKDFVSSGRGWGVCWDKMLECRMEQLFVGLPSMDCVWFRSTGNIAAAPY